MIFLKEKQNIIFKIFNIIKGFFEKLGNDHIGAFSAQSSFFFVLSFFPFIILLLTLLQYTPITEDFLINTILPFIPKTFRNIATSIINDLYAKSGIGLISVSALIAIWSASKGILSLMNGLNHIYNIDKKRNYFLQRLISALYTLAFIVGIIISLSLLVFGNFILDIIHRNIPLIYEIVEFIISIRGLYVPIVLSLIFIVLYKLVPNKNYRLIDHVPGAIFAATGWEIFSYAYSIYIDYYANSVIYGSLTSIIFLLLWLYFCMYILFIGAEINIYFRKHFQTAKNYVKRIKEKD